MVNNEDIMNFITMFWIKHCKSPTIRDIMEGCKISSTSVVSYHLSQLSDDGLIFLGQHNQKRVITPYWVQDAIKEYIKTRKVEVL